MLLLLALDRDVLRDLLLQNALDAAFQRHHRVWTGTAVADELEHDGVAILAVKADEFEVAAILLEVPSQSLKKVEDLLLLVLSHG